MSDQDSVEGETKSDSFLLQAVQQQFKVMNVMFGEIRDQLETQDAAIANLQRGQLPQVPNT